MGDQLEFADESGIGRLVGTLHDPQAPTGQVLTVQADKSIAAARAGIQVVTGPVSSAEVLALFTTPVTLIPGVPGFITVPSEVGIVYLAGATPYTDHGGAIVVNTGVYNWFSFPSAGLWDQAASQFFPQSYTASGPTPLAGVGGADVVLEQDTANPTLGDGTLLVTASYFLAPSV